VLIETNPPGAQIWDGSHLVGLTPRRVKIEGDRRLRLRLAGYDDGFVDVSRDSEWELVPLHHSAGHGRHDEPIAPYPTGGHSTTTPPSHTTTTTPTKKPKIGLDD
jgi:hypothetical protein